MENLHHDPVVPILFSVAIILLSAKIGGAVASYFKQPDVLGELVAGIIMGNLTLLNYFIRQPMRGSLTGAVTS